MIDLHTHLLPGIDDGAPDMATALELARYALASGTTHLVCTPHLHEGRYTNTRASIEAAVREFAAALAGAHIALPISAGAEARFGIELMMLAKQDQLPFLGQWNGRRVLLLEFPHSQVPHQADKLTGWLLANEIQPLIAHPERNRGLMGGDNYKKLEPLLEQGCLLQVTASSLSGGFGPQARELAERLLLEGHISVLASDGHNLQHRPPDLRPGLEQAVELIGEIAAMRLVQDNPWHITQDHFQANAA